MASTAGPSTRPRAAGSADARQQAVVAWDGSRRGDAVVDRLAEPRTGRLADLVCESATMREFMAVARRVVEANTPLLVLGETGVGKERLARAIHADGPRSAGPFVAVNCGALPEGLLEAELFGHEQGAFTGATRSRKGFFELAHGGTLFLDEIGDVPLHLQVKLLRALEDRSVRRVGSERTQPIDVRVLAATNRHLEADVAAKQFRADLYYRLAVVTLVVPPLRERREDIAPLVRRYVDHFRIQVGRPVRSVAPDAMERLIAYAWPGNVRELINVVERALLLATTETITLHELPTSIVHLSAQERPRDSLAHTEAAGLSNHLFELPLRQARRQTGDAFERAYLTELLRRANGRIVDTARMAAVDVRTIHGLMRKHGLQKEAFRSWSGRPSSQTTESEPPARSSTR